MIGLILFIVLCTYNQMRLPEAQRQRIRRLYGVVREHLLASVREVSEIRTDSNASNSSHTPEHSHTPNHSHTPSAPIKRFLTLKQFFRHFQQTQISPHLHLFHLGTTCIDTQRLQTIAPHLGPHPSIGGFAVHVADSEPATLSVLVNAAFLINTDGLAAMRTRCNATIRRSHVQPFLDRCIQASGVTVVDVPGLNPLSKYSMMKWESCRRFADLGDAKQVPSCTHIDTLAHDIVWEGPLPNQYVPGQASFTLYANLSDAKRECVMHPKCNGLTSDSKSGKWMLRNGVPSLLMDSSSGEVSHITRNKINTHILPTLVRCCDAAWLGPHVVPVRDKIAINPPVEISWFNESACGQNDTVFPKIIHQTWFGPMEKLGRHKRKLMQGCRQMHEKAGWKYILWTDNNISKLYQQEGTSQLINHDWFATGEPIVRSDLARMEILFAHGGLYLDADSECLRPFDPLHENLVSDRYECYAGIEMKNKDTFKEFPTGLIAQGTVGCVKHAVSMMAMVTSLLYSARNNPPWIASGPYQFSSVINYWNLPVKLLPSHVFYPLHHSDGSQGNAVKSEVEKSKLIEGGSYANQHWSSTHSTWDAIR